MKKKILIACEESQAVCKAFRLLGHNAWSCDLQPCSGGRPEWHYHRDCTGPIMSQVWDIIIFHPDCTKMAVSGNRWYGKNTIGFSGRLKAVQWTVDMWELIKRHSLSSVLENPVSVVFQHLEGGSLQYIQPWQFGHGETKKTGLYIRNLPELKPTCIVSGREQIVWKMPPSADRKKLRSKTYHGIAKAMAEQWGGRSPVLGEEPLPEHCGERDLQQPTAASQNWRSRLWKINCSRQLRLCGKPLCAIVRQ